MSTDNATLKTTPLDALHRRLGARMVPFAGYSMPVQYAKGLVTEHHHTRTHAGLFDVSHMGQLRLIGADAAAAFESLMPVDVVDLPIGKQRYGLLLNASGGILDDLMFVNRGDDIFIIVNGACKDADIAHIQQQIGQRCTVEPLPNLALLALQGPHAIKVLQELIPEVSTLVFMTGAQFTYQNIPLFITRSGYTGEDGFEISLPASDAETFTQMLLNNPAVALIGLGARNSLRLEAGLSLYGSDLNTTTTPVEASLQWAISKVRRSGGAREGGFIGSDVVLAQLTNPQKLSRKLVGLISSERIPVRDHTALADLNGKLIGEITSGLLAPTVNAPIALAYVTPAFAKIGSTINAQVRDKLVAMTVTALPFVPNRYFRG